MSNIPLGQGFKEHRSIRVGTSSFDHPRCCAHVCKRRAERRIIIERGGGAPQSAWAYVHGRDERAVVARRRRSPTLPRHLIMSIRLLEVLVDHPAASPVLSLPPRAFNICIITSQSPDT